MKWNTVKNIGNQIVWYKSDLQVIVKEDEMGYKQFDNKAPKYIITKEDDKCYHLWKLDTYYITDYFKNSPYLENKSMIYQNYTKVYDGLLLKDMKELAEETEAEENF